MKARYLFSCLAIVCSLGATVVADTTSHDTTDGIPNGVLTAISQQAILPLYKTADQKTTELQREVIRFCNQPSSKQLKLTRQHWSEALKAWETSEVALFGPALQKQRDLHIYFRPVKKRVIKKLLSQSTAISLDNLEFAGVGAQGFATLEYLLFDREVNDAELLKRFNGDLSGNGNRYCQHLLATSTLLQRDMAAIYNEWLNGYADAIAFVGSRENPVFTNKQQVLEVVLGKLDQLSEAVINKLRHALAKNAQLAGKDEARETVNAYKLEAWRSGHTLANIMANIQGIEHLLKQGGLLDWLNQSGESQLVEQLAQSLKRIREIPFPGTDLFAQLEAKELNAADTLFNETLALSKLIHQMAPKLGVQLGFNDSDGD